MALGSFKRIILGTGLSGTDNADDSITIDVTGSGGVDSLAASGDTPMTGALEIAAGTGVTVTQDDVDTITIAASGSGIPTDGWVTSADTWVYASGSGGGTATFTIAGVDRRLQLSKGTRIKLTQTSAKYFVVIAVSFSTNTTVTVTAGTSYTLANAAISSPFYSYVANPEGWPDLFTFAPAQVGFAGGGGTVANFMVVGTLCFVHFDFSSTSSGTTASFTLPVPTPDASNITQLIFGVNAGTNIYAIANNSTTTQCDFYPTAALGAWTNSSTRRCLGSFVYQF